MFNKFKQDCSDVKATASQKIHLTVRFDEDLASESAKFRKFELYSGSRSSKVIDLGVNRKPMYDFLLVTNSNFGRTATVFEILTLS